MERMDIKALPEKYQSVWNIVFNDGFSAIANLIYIYIYIYIYIHTYCKNVLQ